MLAAIDTIIRGLEISIGQLGPVRCNYGDITVYHEIRYTWLPLKGLGTLSSIMSASFQVSMEEFIEISLREQKIESRSHEWCNI